MTVTIQKVKDAPDQARESVGRSGIASPYFDLTASIAVAEAIEKKGGGVSTPDHLAVWLGYKSTASGTYLTRVSAANKHFGLIDASRDRITTTERAKKIISPVLPDDAVNARVEAFLAVLLFSKVFDQFRGSQLPPEAGLKNLFRTTYKILPDRVAQSVRVFLNSAEQAGFFSTSGDRSRLIKPTGAIATQPVATPLEQKIEPSPAHEKSKGGGVDGTGGVHSAIIGLLRELPPPGTPWSAQKKERFLQAFKSTVDFIYPEEGAT